MVRLTKNFAGRRMAAGISSTSNTLDRQTGALHSHINHDEHKTSGTGSVRLPEGDVSPQGCFNGKALSVADVFYDELFARSVCLLPDLGRNVDVAAAVQVGSYVVDVEIINAKIYKGKRG